MTLTGHTVDTPQLQAVQIVVSQPRGRSHDSGAVELAILAGLLVRRNDKFLLTSYGQKAITCSDIAEFENTYFEALAMNHDVYKNLIQTATTTSISRHKFTELPYGEKILEKSGLLESHPIKDDSLIATDLALKIFSGHFSKQMEYAFN